MNFVERLIPGSSYMYKVKFQGKERGERVEKERQRAPKGKEEDAREREREMKAKKERNEVLLT